MEAKLKEFLTCRLADESYGIDILRIQEIREFDQITRVPLVSPFVRGVINLRGSIVPIVDLGLMFGFPEPLDLKKSIIIVLNDNGKYVGLAVSAVSDVVAMSESEIKPAPDLGRSEINASISGIGLSGDTSILLLNVDHLLSKIRSVENAKAA